MATKSFLRTFLHTLPFLLAVRKLKAQDYVLPYEVPQDCDADKFFNIAELKCQSCPEKMLTSASGLSCQCDNGYKEVPDSTNAYRGLEISCQACFDNEVTTNDGLNCILCGNGAPNPTTGACPVCNQGEVIVQYDPDGSLASSSRCLTCDLSMEPDAEGERCVPCHTSHTDDDGKCSCMAPFVLSGGVCFSEEDLLTVEPSAYNVPSQSSSDGVVASWFFTEYLLSVESLCRNNGNFTACQLLGNLCVMVDYNTDEFGATCEAYSNIDLGSANDIPDCCSGRIIQFGVCVCVAETYPDLIGGQVIQKPSGMPWLFYTDDVNQILTDTAIQTTFSTNTSSVESMLNIFVAEYDVTGNFEGISSAQDGKLQLCPDTMEKLNAAYVFGTTYTSSCTIPSRMFWDSYTTVLLDPYLYFIDGINNEMLHAVPVLVDNLKRVGNYVNRAASSRNWELTRRFFLVDNVSGKTAADAPAAFVRYASDIELVVTLQTEEGMARNGRIYPPLLRVKYSELSRENDYEGATQAKVTFRVTYSMDQRAGQRGLSITLGVLGALAALYGLVKSNAWRRRSGLIYIDIKTMFKFIAFTCGLLGNVFFAVIFGYSSYWLLFFKKQDMFNVVLPTNEQEGAFIAYVVMAFVFKALDLLHLFVVQCTADIFLIDWERSRGRLVQANEAAANKGNPAPVSIWRTYFVANEWNELQATRKSSVGIQLMVTLFFLEVVGLVHLTTTDPVGSINPDPNSYYGGYDVVLRFAAATGIYLIIAAVQWIFFTFFYDRFVEDVLQNFVDLCSMANVSVFILSANSFGHYIHGRSVHGFADTNMKEMQSQLKREEENLVGQRGLLPNNDQQTFEMLLQNKFRENYDRILQPLNLTQAEQQRANQAQGRGGAKVDSTLEAYATMSKFLSAFIDHGMRDIDYLVKDKLLFEKVLDMEFYDPIDKGFFFNDDGHSFDQVIFFGHESTLLLFEILLFCVVDLIFQSYLMAGIVTYIASMVISHLRGSLGSINLARKTLVDKRFLI